MKVRRVGNFETVTITAHRNHLVSGGPHDCSVIGEIPGGFLVGGNERCAVEALGRLHSRQSISIDGFTRDVSGPVNRDQRVHHRQFRNHCRCAPIEGIQHTIEHTGGHQGASSIVDQHARGALGECGESAANALGASIATGDDNRGGVRIPHKISRWLFPASGDNDNQALSVWPPCDGVDGALQNRAPRHGDERFRAPGAEPCPTAAGDNDYRSGHRTWLPEGPRRRELGRERSTLFLRLSFPREPTQKSKSGVLWRACAFHPR